VGVWLAAGVATAGPIGAGNGPASAAPKLPVEGLITEPDWAERPTGEDVARYYPTLAQYLRLSGRAEITCSVTKAGALSGCTVIGQIPVGLGFGEAAMKLSPLFRMRPRMLNGEPVSGGVVRIPIRFSMTPDAPAGAGDAVAQTGPAPTPAAMALAGRIVSAAVVESQLRATIKVQMERFREQVSGAGLTQEEQLALDLFEQAENDFVEGYRERLVAAYARAIPEAELAPIAAFLESPAGRTWVSTGTEITLREASKMGYDQATVGIDARTRLCRQITCLPGDGAPAP
jgi:TonB family protein